MVGAVNRKREGQQYATLKIIIFIFFNTYIGMFKIWTQDHRLTVKNSLCINNKT